MKDETGVAYSVYMEGFDSCCDESGGGVNPYDFITQYDKWKLFERGFQAAFLEKYGRNA